MKKTIHPEWFPKAQVVCSCGNKWITGATVVEIRTDICSACHPFYTGKQRIVDTEGRVDKFVKRLQERDRIHTDVAKREADKTPMDLPIGKLDVSQRTVQALESDGIHVIDDFIKRLDEGGDESLLAIRGVGRQRLSEMKKALRNAGYDLPEASEPESN